MDMPWPRLPKWIGTPNLRANQAVYPRIDLDVNMAPQELAVAAGAIASVLNIDTTLLPNWSTRFASVFKEFAIVGARFELRVNNVTAPQGTVLAFIDEEAAAAPTATAVNYAHAEVPMVGSSVDSTGSIHVVEWVARSYADLTWDLTSTAGTVGYLKVFGNQANTGLAAATAASISVVGTFAIAFRGYV